MLVNRNSQSLWRSIIDDQQISSLLSHPSDSTYNDNNGNSDEDGDYADILSPEYEIDRKQIQIIELLGNGQFGEVYRGILKVLHIRSLFLFYSTFVFS